MKVFTNEFNPDIEVVCIDGVLKTHKVCLQFLSECFNTYFTTGMHTESIPILEYPRSVLLYIMNVLFYRVKGPHISCSEYYAVAHCADFLMIDDDESLVRHMVCTLGCKCNENHEELQDLFIAHRKIFSEKPNFKEKIIRTIDSSELPDLLASRVVHVSDLSRKQHYELYVSGYRTREFGKCNIIMGNIMDLLNACELYEVLSHLVYNDNNDEYSRRYMLSEVERYLTGKQVSSSELLELRCSVGVPSRMQKFMKKYATLGNANPN